MKTVNLAAFALVLAVFLGAGFAFFPSVALADDPVIVPVTFGFDEKCDGKGILVFPLQITGKIVDLGGGKVEIIFSNGMAPYLNPVPSSITKIDFAGIGTLFGSIADGFTGFNEYNDEPEGNQNDIIMIWNGGHPANIPTPPGCDYEASAFVGADNPAPKHGIEETEGLGIVFTLQPGKKALDVVDACAEGDLRFALHVQSIDSMNDGSIKLYNLNCVEIGTTYISLASSTIKKVDGGIEVNWETGVEIDTVGFNLYRASSFDGTFVKVNDQLVGAYGNGAGAAYSVVDPNGSASDLYRLEDIDSGGVSTLRDLNRSNVAQGNGARLFIPMLALE